jgi:hypothetical protein
VRLWVIGTGAVALVVLLAGCGGGGGSAAPCISHGIKCENLPKHTIFRVNWVENASVDGKPIATFRVRTIEVGPDGYKIEASFTNTSPEVVKLPEGTARSPNDFGLGVFLNALPQRIQEEGNYLLKAQQIRPPLPATVAPGKTWSGTMTSDNPPRSGRSLRVLFGVFFWKGKPPYGLGPYFIWQTNHQVRSPEPVGGSGSS